VVDGGDVYRFLELIERAGEKVILGFHPDQIFRTIQAGEIRFHLRARSELVVRALDKDPWDIAVAEQAAGRIGGGKTGREQAARARDFAPKPKNDSGAERESRQ